MQSGRIAPTFRQFFREALSATKNSTDSHSQQQQQQGEPEREPTPEEAQEALKVLAGQEEFQKSSLRAELQLVEGRQMIVVLDRLGHQLKGIRGQEILRILHNAKLGRKGPQLGRILDRRI